MLNDFFYRSTYFRAVMAVIIVFALAGTLLDVRLLAAKKAAAAASKKGGDDKSAPASGLKTLESGKPNFFFISLKGIPADEKDFSL